MCGAFAMSAPAASNSAQEKSSRSRMLTETAVACSTAPICSATCMNRWLKSSSCAGSARPASTAAACRGSCAREAERAVGEALGRPAGLDDGRRIGLDDERRARRSAACGASAARSTSGHVAPAVEPGLGATARARLRALDARRWPSRSPATMASTAQRRDQRVGAPAAQSRSAASNTARNSRSTSAQRRVRRSRARFPCPARATRACGAAGLRAVPRPGPSWRRAAARRSPSNAASSSACRPGVSARSRLCRRTSRRSASPMPKAESTPASGWIRISRMPSESATRQACCGAAPP